MKLTLLKCVQLILSGMDSDEVNSIDGSVEAQQVVDILETTYYDLAATIDFPDMWDFFELEPSGDVTRPTLMSLPARVSKVEWIKYDISEGTVRDFKTVLPMPREKFFDRMNSMDSAADNIYNYQLNGPGGATTDVRGYNDRVPAYYTTNNDRTLIFDNYVATEGSTLQGNKTHCYGLFIPEFLREDDFIPEFEPRQFSLYYNEAKAQCFIDLKQVQNAKAEQRARRGWVQAHRKSPQTPVGDIYHSYTPNFHRGRR